MLTIVSQILTPLVNTLKTLCAASGTALIRRQLRPLTALVSPFPTSAICLITAERLITMTTSRSRECPKPSFTLSKSSSRLKSHSLSMVLTFSRTLAKVFTTIAWPSGLMLASISDRPPPCFFTERPRWLTTRSSSLTLVTTGKSYLTRLITRRTRRCTSLKL